MAERPGGMEIMVRSLMKATGVDPDEIFGAIKQLIEQGTLQKIVQFADDLPKLVERLDGIERAITGLSTGEFDGRSLAIGASPFNGSDLSQDVGTPLKNFGGDQ